MSRFGENSKAFFEEVYNNAVPWEIGTIQPELLKLIEMYPPSGKVLDIGCGSGDTAIDIARLGYRVVSIDFVESAIEKAREKIKAISKKETLQISFICENGLMPSKIGTDFAAIVDSGFMHLFDDADLHPYTEEMYATLEKKGRVYLIEFSYEFEIPNAPRAISDITIKKMFDDDKWEILSMKKSIFINKVSPVPAIAACIEKRN